MLIATDTPSSIGNHIGNFEWVTTGNDGAIEVPDFLGFELIAQPGEHYWAVDGTKPKPKAQPKVDPVIDLKEDESTGDDIADALDASNVGARPKARARKTTKE